MNDGYEITCARPSCGNITFSGKQRGAVDGALEAHVEAFHNYMSGQEWYDRFLKETAGRVFPYRTDKEQALVVEVAGFFSDAARKAAGL